MGYSPWGRKESDTIERLTHTFLPLQPGTYSPRQSVVAIARSCSHCIAK